MKKMKYRLINVMALVFLLFGKFAWADTVLLDPATLAVGTSIGEFLEVKEGCPDPSKINCQATEKMKYISAVAGRTGKIEFDVNLTDNFELDVNVNLDDFVQQAITLFKTDNENSLYIRFSGWIEFTDKSSPDEALGWQGGNSINDVELSAKNGTAFLNINGTPFKANSGKGDTVALDTSKPFVKLVIAGIKDTDRLFEVTLKGGTGGTTPVTGGDFDSGKQAGIQQCVNDPASCGITVTAGGDFDSGKQAGIQECKDNPSSYGLQRAGGVCQTACVGTVDFEAGKQNGIEQCVGNPTSCGITAAGGAHATYTPTTGEVHIPLIDVPGPFGDQQVYEVFLIQQPSTFSFDLDLNRLNLRQ